MTLTRPICGHGLTYSESLLFLSQHVSFLVSVQVARTLRGRRRCNGRARTITMNDNNARETDGASSLEGHPDCRVPSSEAAISEFQLRYSIDTISIFLQPTQTVKQLSILCRNANAILELRVITGSCISRIHTGTQRNAT